MKSFKDFTGIEGIDKLTELAPVVIELMSDKDIWQSVTEDTAWIELGTKMYKAHTEACEKLYKELEYEPTSSIELVSGIAHILRELYNDKDLLSFFISMSGQKKSLISAMANTEEERSKAS